MSTEAEVAMLMLRLLIDKPKELQKVLDYLQHEVIVRKAVLEVGNLEVASREQILGEFEEKYGLVVEITDDESDNDGKTVKLDKTSDRVIGLPSGALFKVG